MLHKNMKKLLNFNKNFCNMLLKIKFSKSPEKLKMKSINFKANYIIYLNI